MGIGASLDMWGRFEEAMISRGYQTISFDLPGAGASPAAFPPRRMRGLAHIALGVLDVLGLETADVLGVSFGGVVAQEIARQGRERVRRLVLCATGPGLGGIPAKPSILLRLATPRRYWSPDYAASIADQLYGGRARVDPHQQGAMPARFERPPTIYGYLTQVYAIAGWTSIPWLRGIRTQTLILNGDDDPIVPVCNGRIMARLLPNARLVVINGGGHLFLLDQTTEVVALVDEFLSRTT